MNSLNLALAHSLLAYAYTSKRWGDASPASNWASLMEGDAMIKGFRLYAKPSFLSGAARLVDIGGVFDQYNTSDSEEEADSLALASDWSVIGDDLRQAMGEMDKELNASR